jgi:hypothetical protein
MKSSLAIVTPSYAPDYELCRTLNRSVLEYLPEWVKHYIFVDRRDLKMFRSLAGQRTIVASKEEVIPKGMVQIPGANRWFGKSSVVPITGWLVQQIAKIATADILDEATLVMVDSDALFVRDVDPALLGAEDTTRLYRCPDGITPQMSDHIVWHNNACELLNVTADQPPMTDYIGQIISWNRNLVQQMCRRIEAVSGTSWYSALARKRSVSEYLLYGLFIEKVLGPTPKVWIDERSRCKSHWQSTPLLDSELMEFSAWIPEGDIALMISSHSTMSIESRRAAVAIATNGRVR